MIHIFIGTKAQFIKTAPVIKELDKRQISYNLIDSGQHAGISQKLIQLFGLRQPDIYLRKEGTDIVSFGQAISWVLKWGLKAILNPQGIKQQLFRGQDGICLIHGDTLSTLLALLLAKRAGIKVGHIEAGLRSYNLWHPFPEELIRLITMRKADILFAPSQWAYDNLERMKVKGKIVNLRENTIADTIRYALAQKTEGKLPSEDYVLATIHRLETICSKKRLKQVVGFLGEIAATYKLVFVLHKPTENQLRKFSLLGELEDNTQIQLLPLQDYFEFLHLLRKCKFVITDGGSVQEESYYLDVPCLVMRKKTERQEGLGENVCITEFSKEKINYFCQNYAQFKRKTRFRPEAVPSQLVVNELL